MQSGLENTCLSVCPQCLLAFVPECDAPACCVQDRHLRFIILTGNPTAKCSRALSWKQGVKSWDWWVLCFPLLESQGVSSQGENAPHNHYLNIFFTKNLLVWFRARFFWTVAILSICLQHHSFLLLDKSAKINAKKKKTFAGILPLKH